jgi:N-acetylglucosaminyldiphosphoundecaprenol N-acetyl-beta-D-mannosaminyltransferase
VRRITRTASERHSARPRRITVDGVGFDAVTEAQAVDTITAAARAGRGGTVVTPNVDILRQVRDSEDRLLVAAADLVVADGMPIVWASRLQRDPLPARVTGSSLIRSLSHRVLREGGTVAIVGGAPRHAARAAEVLHRAAGTHSGRVAHLSPPFGFESNPMEAAKISDFLADVKPTVVFLGLGFPKQERLGEGLRTYFPEAWFVGCGGSIAMVAGEVSRAPRWIQAVGAEWLYRFAQEPARLFRRYFIQDIPFAVGLLRRAALTRPGGHSAIVNLDP